MKEKRMNALWQPHLWSGLLRVQFVPHYPIPNGTVVWFKFSQGRYLVQAALKQGRVYEQKRRGWHPDPILADIDREYVEAAAEARRLGRRGPT